MQTTRQYSNVFREKPEQYANRTVCLFNLIEAEGTMEPLYNHSYDIAKCQGSFGGSLNPSPIVKPFCPKISWVPEGFFPRCHDRGFAALFWPRKEKKNPLAPRVVQRVITLKSSAHIPLHGSGEFTN